MNEYNSNLFDIFYTPPNGLKIISHIELIFILKSPLHEFQTRVHD